MYGNKQTGSNIQRRFDGFKCFHSSIIRFISYINRYIGNLLSASVFMVGKIKKEKKKMLLSPLHLYPF